MAGTKEAFLPSAFAYDYPKGVVMNSLLNGEIFASMQMDCLHACKYGRHRQLLLQDGGDVIGHGSRVMSWDQVRRDLLKR